jgi:dihydroorotase
MTTPEIQLPKWFDLHTHFRQGENVAAYISDHLAMGCAGALAMPNTLPPVSKIDGPNSDTAWSIKSYRQNLIEAGADQFEQLIVPLYLTKDTTAANIEHGAKTGLLRACKYYPPHGTTNSAHGIPISQWIGSDVLRAIADHGIILCLHGEQHGLTGSDYFDAKSTAESKFYLDAMPRLLDAHPNLRIVCEHITTATAVDFVKNSPAEQVGATITPQHLLYTVGHLIQGLRYHLYCLPIVKFEADRAALRAAATTASQTQFFAGTDSAPHTTKATDCGCAAGCYTGGCAPQLYAMAFEHASADPASETFKRFLCTNGPDFYKFPISKESFTLERLPSKSALLKTSTGHITPLPLGMDLEMTWSIR